nr:dihydroxy-acid dehydratase [Sphingomonas daechungensis]
MSSKGLPSREVVEGPSRAPARAMLHAAGFNARALSKPLIAIVHSFSTVTPCNMHLRDLAQHAARGIEEAGGPRSSSIRSS